MIESHILDFGDHFPDQTSNLPIMELDVPEILHTGSYRDNLCPLLPGS